jgi:hypothetical protein
MATSTQAPSIDVGALSAAIKTDVTDRLATLLTAGFESLDENGQGLNQLQRAELTQWALDTFDGLEAEIAGTLIAEFARKGVAAWGLSTELSYLLPKDGDDA